MGPATTPSISVAFKALEDRVARMERAFDTNTSVFSDGIKFLEVQNVVTLRIMEDVFNGRVRVASVSTDSDGIPRAIVDVTSYTREYLEALTRMEETPKQEPAPVLASVDDDSPIIFGGGT